MTTFHYLNFLKYYLGLPCYNQLVLITYLCNLFNWGVLYQGLVEAGFFASQTKLFCSSKYFLGWFFQSYQRASTLIFQRCQIKLKLWWWTADFRQHCCQIKFRFQRCRSKFQLQLALSRIQCCQTKFRFQRKFKSRVQCCQMQMVSEWHSQIAGSNHMECRLRIFRSYNKRYLKFLWPEIQHSKCEILSIGFGVWISDTQQPLKEGENGIQECRKVTPLWLLK